MEGVREPVGVRYVKESPRSRDDGVCGKIRVLVASDLRGVPSLLDGVIGKGIAKS